jgi:hypothetical protein
MLEVSQGEINSIVSEVDIKEEINAYELWKKDRKQFVESFSNVLHDQERYLQIELSEGDITQVIANEQTAVLKSIRNLEEMLSAVDSKKSFDQFSSVVNGIIKDSVFDFLWEKIRNDFNSYEGSQSYKSFEEIFSAMQKIVVEEAEVFKEEEGTEDVGSIIENLFDDDFLNFNEYDIRFQERDLIIKSYEMQTVTLRKFDKLIEYLGEEKIVNMILGHVVVIDPMMEFLANILGVRIKKIDRNYWNKSKISLFMEKQGIKKRELSEPNSEYSDDESFED